MKISIKYRLSIYIEFEIDEQDLHLVIGQCCRASKRGEKFYLYNFEKLQYVHRLITECPKGLYVDHIDGNPQNNKRDNLRIVTSKQNSYNKSKQNDTSSKFKGVCYYPSLKKYRAYINHDGKRINLGYYRSEQDAAIAYNTKASELFGEYAKLNPIPE